MSNSGLVNVNVPAYSGNYTEGRSGRKIEYIAIHHMAGVLSAEQCGKIFQKVGRKGSSHYGVGKDGEIGQYVDESNTAWCNSNWDSNCKSVTIETSNSAIGGDYPVSDVTLDSLIKLVADIAKRNNITLVKGKTLVWHSMYANTNCPGAYLLSKLDYIIEQVNKINNTSSAETSSQTTKSIEDLANEVIAGKYGTGDARKQALGSLYNEVQAKVNEILGATTATTTNKKSNEEIAQEVINGAWGNGDDRKNKLTAAGYDYSTIQALVNQKLTGKTATSNKKSNETIADEVIKGLWGNGTDRKTKLTQAGYDYDAIQKIVNSKLK
jgi:hypothetical protein